MGNELAKARAHLVEHSAAFLPNDSPLYRKPRFAFRSRPPEFFEGFEQKALIYDVFRGNKAGQVLLIGPPPRNLMSEFRRAKFTVEGSERTYKPRFFISQSVMIIALENVPEGAQFLNFVFAGHEFHLPIQPNYSKMLTGKRLIFTMSKDNPLPWIAGWADYHCQIHGANALVLIDNGSSNATPAQIAAALEDTGIGEIFILSMPYIFGAIDHAVIFEPFWTNFLQLCANSIVLRRFGAQAQGLLNCDIDELAMHRSATSVFDALQETPKGLLAMKGAWVEAYPFASGNGDHRDFGYRLADENSRTCHQRKWVLDPKQDWVQHLDVHPYWHWIHGRPTGAKTMSDDAFFWHFKGINNNWKVARNVVGEGSLKELELDQELLKTFSRWRQLAQPDKSQ